MSPILILILLLFWAGIFSWAELAIIWIPLYKVRQEVNKNNNKYAKLLLKLKKNPERTLITILIGSNLMNVVLSIYASIIWYEITDSFWISAWIWFLIISLNITFLMLFFGEILPKVFATRFSLYFGMLFSPIIYWLSYILFPIVWLLEFIIKLINKLIKPNEDKVSKDIVSMFVEDWEKQWIISNIESRIIKNLLNFNEKTVENILQHRTKVFALDWETTLKKAIEKISKKTYSRIPVFSEDKDNIIWTITIRDIINLINENKDLNAKLINLNLNKIFKIPVTASVFNVFLRMKKSWQHFSIVLDEQWWTAWIVTFEDVLEELVWDIKDETDILDEKEIHKISKNEIIVTWEVSLRDILAEFNIKNFKLPKDIEDKVNEDDTISYIILSRLQKFAKVWEKIQIWILDITIKKLNTKWESISEVNIKIKDNTK